jgi:hypothetical protein
VAFLFHLPLPLPDFEGTPCHLASKVSHLTHQVSNVDCVLSPTRPWLTISGWIDEYGPVITMRSKFERIVIIGRYKVSPVRCIVTSSLIKISLQAAVEIMENQGKLLADRPPMIAAGEMFSGGMSIAFIPFVDRLRRMRRLVICDTSTDLILPFNVIQGTSFSSPT